MYYVVFNVADSDVEFFYLNITISSDLTDDDVVDPSEDNDDAVDPADEDSFDPSEDKDDVVDAVDKMMLVRIFFLKLQPCYSIC